VLTIAVEAALNYVGRQHQEFTATQSLMEQEDEEDINAPTRFWILKWIYGGLRVQKFIQEFDDIRRQ
jgi:hypothetical protein